MAKALASLWGKECQMTERAREVPAECLAGLYILFSVQK